MPKQPEDHKPKVEEPFIWTAPNGKKVTLKRIGQLPFGVVRKSRHMGDEDRIMFMLESAVDEAGLAVLDELPGDDTETLWQEWAEASGVEVPQS
jgi:hypothetical protein